MAKNYESTEEINVTEETVEMEEKKNLIQKAKEFKETHKKAVLVGEIVTGVVAACALGYFVKGRVSNKTSELVTDVIENSVEEVTEEAIAANF